MPLRTCLPNRRPSHFETLEVGTRVATACIGFDPATGRPREVFLSGAKDGTDLAAILDDASVILSVALQHDIPASALARSVARLPTEPLAPAPPGPAGRPPGETAGHGDRCGA